MAVTFLLADNLSRLARYLRMLGYDSAIYKQTDFSNRIRLTEKERRIYLTRSQRESKSKRQFSRFLIKSEQIEKQVKELSEYISYQEENVFTRCINCNKLLRKASKDKIKNLVPIVIFNTFEEFHFCVKCGKIYWNGTHYMNMKETLRKWLQKPHERQAE